MASRWFGGRTKVSPELADALAELAKLAQQKPSLATSCAVLEEILTALFAEPAVEVPPTLEFDLAQEKLAAGVPLLRGERLTFDAKSFERCWLAVCKAAQRQNANAKPLAKMSSDLDLAALVAEVLAGRPEAVHARAAALGLDAALTATVLRFSAFPVLAKFAAALDDLRRESAWDYGYCPTCGSWPLLGEFRGLEQTRFLRCGLCATGWGFPRLRCPFCDNRDHRQLGFFHVESEETRCRATTCEACRGYVKTVSTLSALGSPHLLVTDLATLHLDLAAADRGHYVP